MTTTSTVPRSPRLPVIVAKSMLYSQGWRASDAERNTIKAYADWYRATLELTGPVEINLQVVDIYRPTVVLGWITLQQD